MREIKVTNLYTEGFAWAAKIVGDEISLTALKRYLGPYPIDPDKLFMLELEGEYLLCDKKWNALKTAEDVWAEVNEVLKSINGLNKILNFCAPVKLDAVLQIKGPAKADIQRIHDITIHVALPEDKHASVVEFNKKLSILHDSRPLHRCASHLAEITWFSIYKAIEELEEHYGGEKYLVKSGVLGANELKKIKQTANSHRHSATIHQPPSKPVSINEAHKAVGQVLAQVLDVLAKGR